MRIQELCTLLESLAPLAWQEDYDNCGLLTGNPADEITGVLITLDCLEAVVDEAIQKRCNVIVAHHPIIFKGLKKITPSSYVERTVIKAIQHQIAIYAIHTNLDNVRHGVNAKIAERLGLQNTRILAPKLGLLKKLVVFVPPAQSQALLDGLYQAGAGQIGDYTHCSYQLDGQGTFLPGAEAKPTIGEKGKVEYVQEKRLEVIYPAYLERRIIATLYKNHPYEEPAFDLIPLSNSLNDVGAGMIGSLATPMQFSDFLIFIKEKMELRALRHSPAIKEKVQKIALCGGAGSFLIRPAIAQGADVLVTSDLKYHEFFDADNKLILTDIGHYESEKYTKALLYDFLIKKMSNIALILSETITNPISYA